ncbi:hypothetical protein KAR91_82310 [Candidatus Pacearchaeota archaeon]|nr:hypothetical protein [Candidatus Pacearchaeota archaeon]
MKIGRSNLIGLFLILAGFFVSFSGSDVPVSEAAFGTSPPWVMNDHMLPGTTYEQIINLSRSDVSKAMEVSLRFDGDKNLLKSMKVENEDDLIIKSGEKTLPMKVTVKVPRRAALKNYRGGIFVTVEPVQDEVQRGGNVAIKLGAHIAVNITVVGDKLVDYRVKSANVSPLTEEDYFRLNVEVENLGNTEISELNGQVDIYNEEETEILNTLTFGQIADVVSPDDIVRTQVYFEDYYLEPGSYWVVAKFFKDNELVYENRLHQKIDPKVVPVVTSDDSQTKKPSIAQVSDGQVVLDPDQEVLPGEAVSSEVHSAAPAPLTQANNTLFIVFGLAGLIFGLVALVAIVFLLIVLIKNQRQAAIQQYLSSGCNVDSNKSNPSN